MSKQNKFINFIKKHILYFSFLIFFCFFILLIASLSILKYHYVSGENYKFLQKKILFLSEIPFNIKKIFQTDNLNINAPPYLKKHIKKDRIKHFVSTDKNALLVLSRYNHSLASSVIDIINLNNFKTIHSYKPDIKEIIKKTRDDYDYSNFKNYHSEIRSILRHPLLLKDGSLITNSGGPIFKIDFCSKLVWLNDIGKFHHSTELDHEKYIWQVGEYAPKNIYIDKYNKEILDFFIFKLNTDGKIIYKKSVYKILIENKILPENYAIITSTNKNNQISPIHLNDIQPALKNTKYWKTGDLFLSLKHLHAIVHYRPNSNKIINYITGPFSHQHDIDIISEKEISIFNNNTINDMNNSEVLIYNFENQKFTKVINEQLKKDNFQTTTNGLAHFFKDGSLLVEEQNHGRIIIYDKNGNKELEYVNKDKNGNIGLLKWVRVIENQEFIDKFKKLSKNKVCLN